MEVDTWSKRETKALIESWKKYPLLYDINHPNHSDSQQRKLILIKILEHLAKFRPNVTFYSVKRKMRTLQSQLSREKARYFNKTQNNEPYTPALWCYYDLQFLLNIKSRKHYLQEDESQHQNDTDDKGYEKKMFAKTKNVQDNTNSGNENQEFIEEINIINSPSHKTEEHEFNGCTIEDDFDDSYDSAPFSPVPEKIQNSQTHKEEAIQDDEEPLMNPIKLDNDHSDECLEKLQQKRVKAEINYLNRKSAYFSELMENVRVERRLMNLKAHKLAIEIKQLRKEE